MNTPQTEALQAVVGRVLTEEEISTLSPLVEARNDVAIAALLSVGRTHLQQKYIGVGTVLSVMAPSGGAFMDKLVEIGTVDRNVYWAMDLLRLGRLDIGDAVTQTQVASIGAAYPQYQAALQQLLALGRVPNPVNYNDVSDALNVAEGRMTL